MSSVDGLITGLDTTAIVRQIMEAERFPQLLLTARRDSTTRIADSFSAIRSLVSKMEDAARDLSGSLDWQRLTGTSSDPAVVVTAGTGTTSSQLRINVLQRATADAVYSTDTVASLDTVVAEPGESIFTASGYEELGFSALSGSGLPPGEIGFDVTQASGAARVTSTGVAGGYPFEVSQNKLDVELDGAKETLKIEKGTYATVDDLRQAIEDAVVDKGWGADIAVIVNPLGHLELVTVDEGSDATLEIVGGNAAASLGFAVDGVHAGTDAVVEVNGVVNTITDVRPGNQVGLDAGTGTITADIAGPISVGSAEVSQSEFSGGTLAEVVAALNTPGTGVTATAVKVDDGAYRLQIHSLETGDDSSIDIDLGMFTGFSGFTTLTEGQDAVIEVVGDTPYQIRSSTDVFEDILPSTTIEIVGVPDGPVDITVGQDTSAIADSVAALVEAANAVLAKIRTETAYNAESGTAAVLTGNSTVRRLGQAIVGGIIDPVAASSFTSGGLVGISLDRDGVLSFDRTEFEAAMTSDPAAVERLFTDPDAGVDMGIAARLVAVAADAITTGTGYLRTAEEAAEDRAEAYTEQIDRMELRFELREASLRRTYANLEIMLGTLQSQSNWLAGQLGALTSDG